MFVSRRLPPLLHFCSSKYRAELCAPRIWRRKLWIHSAHIWKHTSQVLLWKVWGGRDLQAPPTQSLWCKVPEESPAVVSGDIMQLSWGQCEWARGERFLSPEVATFNDFPAQGDKMFPLLRFDLHTFSLICVDQKKTKKKEQLLRQGSVGLLAEPSAERGTVTGSSVWFQDQFVRLLSFILMEQNYRSHTKAVNKDTEQHEPGRGVCFSLPTTPAWITAQSREETAKRGRAHCGVSLLMFAQRDVEGQSGRGVVVNIVLMSHSPRGGMRPPHCDI